MTGKMQKVEINNGYFGIKQEAMVVYSFCDGGQVKTEPDVSKYKYFALQFKLKNG